MASPMRPTPTMPTRSLLAFIWASGSLWWVLCFRLEHGGERLARIGEIGGIDRHAPLDQPARHRDVALRIDSEHMGDAIAVEVEAHERVGADLPAHLRAGL